MTQNQLPTYKLPAKIETFRERVIEFCDVHVRPRTMEVEASALYPDDLHALFAKAGLLRAVVPDDCDGLGLAGC